MQTYIGLASLICGMGFNTSLLKMAAENRPEKEKRLLYQTAFMVTLLSFAVIYILLYIASSLGLISTDLLIGKLFPLYALFLLPLSIQSLQLSYYQARKKIKEMARLQVILKLLSVVLIVCFTFLYELNGYILFVILTGFLSVIVLEFNIKGVAFSRSLIKVDLNIVKSMWSLAGFALLANIVGTLNVTLDVYLINYLVSDRTEVGYYLFAMTIISVYQILPTSIQQVAFPFFSEKSNDHEGFISSYRKYNNLNHVLILLIVLSGVLIVPPLLKFVFLGKYDQSIHYYLFLSIAWMIKSMNLMKGTALMGCGRFDLNFYGSLITLLISLPAVWALIYLKGLDGALAGMIISSVISYFAVSVIFSKGMKRTFHGV